MQMHMHMHMRVSAGRGAVFVVGGGAVFLGIYKRQLQSSRLWLLFILCCAVFGGRARPDDFARATPPSGLRCVSTHWRLVELPISARIPRGPCHVRCVQQHAWQRSRKRTAAPPVMSHLLRQLTTFLPAAVRPA